MNKNPRSVGALDLYLAPVDSEKLQLHRTLMATATSLGVALMVSGMYWVDMLGLDGLLLGVGMILSGNLISYLMLATGLNKKLQDPSMTKGQNLAASVTMILMAFMASPTGHNLALMMLPAIFVYSSFRFGFVALLKLASIVLGMAIIETLVRFEFGVADGFGQAVVTLVALAVTLVTLSMVGGQFNDMRRRNRAQRAMSHVAMTQLTDAVVTVNRSGDVRFINEGARTLFKRQGELDNLDIDTLCTFTSQQPLSSVLSELADRIDLHAGEQHNKLDQREMLGGAIELPTGSYRFIRLSVSPLLRHSGEVDGFVLVVRDVSDTQRLMKELEHAATHDVLTGLLNRRGFIETLQQTLQVSAGDEHAVSVLAIDLDQFKMVNDSCGHDAGDDLLRVVAAMMRSTVPGEARLARLGGDEFGVILRGMSLPKVELIANRLLREFAELRFVRQERSFRIGASIGVAQHSPDCLEAQSLLSRADSACYLAKQRGRNCVQVYTLGDAEVSRHQRDMSWATRISEALQQQRFVLFAQRITPTVAGVDDEDHFEVLIRLIEADGEVIEPSVFLPAAERFNLISAIDREVIRLAVTSLAQMMQAGKRLPRIAINLSPSSLRDGKLLVYIGRMIKEHRVPGEQITFELTETAAIFDLDQARVFFRGLKDLGCRVALDDVGSGFNSFYNLRQLPIDQIKIDGSYVRSVCENPLDLAFVESIQRIAEILNVKTVAEFVENELIREKMTSIGVNFLQGFGLHKPERLGDVAAMMQDLRVLPTVVAHPTPHRIMTQRNYQGNKTPASGSAH